MRTAEKFCQKYLEYLNGPLAGLNLTRITTPEEFRVKQYDDSLYPLEVSSVFDKAIKEKGILLDVGFGGGFPLLPLAWTHLEVQFVGFEARGKKAKAVNQIAEHLGLSNVSTFHQRLETIIIDRSVVITFKAVSTISNCLDMINSDQEIIVGMYKGPSVFVDEKKDLEQLKDWELIDQQQFNFGEEATRNFLVFKNVPRGTNRNKPLKNIVKLSHFL